MGAGRRLGRGTDASRAASRGGGETRGPAISILFGSWTGFICDTYRVLAWNSRIKSGPGVHASSDEPHTRTRRNRRRGHAEGQSQVAEQVTSRLSALCRQLF
nr:small integral membrane protein 2 [Microcebus murinus]